MPKILLVEDNELNREMLRIRLERKKYDIVFADDGVKAVALAKSELPDLILMDLSLPEMDGWEATRQIKAHEPTAKIPVIALTAHAMASDKESALAAGCDDFDTKPIEWKRLRKKIAEHLERVGAV